MKLGIVGHGAEKFTAATEKQAKIMIAKVIETYGAQEVISGRTPMGGIDIWAVEIAKMLGLSATEYPSTTNRWGGPGGFKERNQRIASESDAVVSIVVESYHEHYRGTRFALCYHCMTDTHVKSGGCWTAKAARGLGKPGDVWIVR